MSDAIKTVPTLVDLLEERAQRDPNREAVVCGRQRVTWSDLYEASRRCVPQVQRVETPLAIVARPDLPTVTWVWAALLSGTTFSTIDPGLPTRSRLELLELLGSTTIADGPGQISVAGVAPHPGDESVASVLFTSGSTGRPKGVAMTAAAMAASVDSICGYLDLRPTDRIWGGLPLCYGYGLYQLFLSAATGAPLVLPQCTALVGETLRILECERISVLPGVPSLWTQLLQAESFRRHVLPRLRIVTNAGEALPLRQLRRLRQRFDRLQIYAMYGLTEYTRVASSSPDEIDSIPNTVGFPIAGCESHIVDERGSILGRGRVGELVVRGPHLMAGYWRDAQATSRCLRPISGDGGRWLHTGDLFEQDADGRLYHRGRRDDVFKCRGQKVSPTRVRQVLESHPSVLQALVMGIATTQETEVVAVLRSCCPLDPHSLRGHCRKRLAPHEVPTRFEAVEDFPRTNRGKIDRVAMRSMIKSTGDGSC